MCMHMPYCMPDHPHDGPHAPAMGMGHAMHRLIAAMAWHAHAGWAPVAWYSTLCHAMPRHAILHHGMAWQHVGRGSRACIWCPWHAYGVGLEAHGRHGGRGAGGATRPCAPCTNHPNTCQHAYVCGWAILGCLTCRSMPDGLYACLMVLCMYT